VLQTAAQGAAAQLVAIADPGLLRDRAAQLGLAVTIRELAGETPTAPAAKGELRVEPVPLAVPCRAGKLEPGNASYVLQTLDRAIAGCQQGRYQAMITAPVNKAVINEAGYAFSGHTEYLAQKTGCERVVMMLAIPQLRVALATTHLPLREVSDAIDADMLYQILTILRHDLQQRFGIPAPHILVLGLNPHAGESGHLGREEIDVIEPVIRACQAEGFNLEGPLPADTAFNPEYLRRADAVLAMYHDQGLPVLKSRGFGDAVNITLGLPIVRTSVDHGTALDLAGTGRASNSSLLRAIDMAAAMAASGRGTG
jgi:4-hydroxythreonine-4-phosphate dehydrogenase